MSIAHRIRRSLSRRFALPLYLSRSHFTRLFLTASVRDVAIRIGLADPLTKLAARYKSDKGVTVFPFHGYTTHYASLFAPLRDKPINILEIGLAREQDRATLGITCPSLSIWVEYFSNAQIYGFDIDDFSGVKLPRTQILRGDQGKVEDLQQIVSACSRFDIIIDDGSHASYHQQLTMATLFPHLASRGLYIIEDLNSQPEPLESELPRRVKTRELVKNRAALDQAVGGVAEVHLFDAPLQGTRDELAVIVKK